MTADAKRQSAGFDLDEFVNPKSMLTPGAAGSVTMLITNTLWLQFDLTPRWTALALSFLLGAVVFASSTQPAAVWQRATLYVVNSLIIFSVGIGTNYLGGTGASSSVVRQAAAHVASLSGLVHPSVAHAVPVMQQATPTPKPFFPPW